jgi:hypothetical protein
MNAHPGRATISEPTRRRISADIARMENGWLAEYWDGLSGRGDGTRLQEWQANVWRALSCMSRHDHAVPSPRFRTNRPPECSGLRGMPLARGHMGSPTTLQDLRTCGLLRSVEEPAREDAPSRDASPHHDFLGTRRALELVLYRPTGDGTLGVTRLNERERRWRTIS